ncbi:hypothetical protein OCL06_01940 [Alteromonas sp. ASW11-19]|uniref:TonB-dependent receptor n=1 Tax=Alteromonas salexigens TaxID=2982530 RepID=A0ABT2VJS4_9ALTE|nr:hypothetical protein [Alteromonas salexigens]MCU7553354.1 hypothetical protein [Alteromonas salexigens]
MFTYRKLLTALVLSAAATTTMAAQKAPTGLETVTHNLVAQSVSETTQELNVGVIRDVLTVSHHFDPQANAAELVADVTIQDIKESELNDNNDA